MALQIESFDWLLGNDAWRARLGKNERPDRGEIPKTSGLEEIFEEISPIEDFQGSMSLSFRDHRFEPSKYTIAECNTVKTSGNAVVPSAIGCREEDQ